MARKILFLHGFFASGACVPALALREYFDGKAEVLTPDLPLHPGEAIDFIQRLCEEERPDILVGNSNGSFLAQMVAARNCIPALLGNPHFEMTRFLAERIGTHEYKSVRANGNQQLVIDQALIDEFYSLQQHQWDYCSPASREQIWGIFGENDHLAHYEPLFLMHYKHAFHFPGGHTPTAEEVQKYYAPLAERLLDL
ncbi:YqiA/YcfP family alpha/beta fold hydrolase [uncultured Bacteroides sp.]|uniref:YqiA/YcfP family alpha/beta fold hydrolase n=1 Tax=uncultured Bacteroides sp. TaxID=162156 RepID=UPI00262BBD80|nr:YqiA/YcfP family alpha/beta fold hydrolase [uncultured Bacteroides sp.]